MVETASRTAVRHSTGLPAAPLRWVLIRDPRGGFDAQALLCADLSADPRRVVSWFARRWRTETTFQEVRRRLGFEAQRHWSETAIRRTAPALPALFSAVAPLAHQKGSRMPQAARGAGPWCEKERPTFSGALAVVRKELWARQEAGFRGSVPESGMVKVPRGFMERLTDAVCYAA